MSAESEILNSHSAIKVLYAEDNPLDADLTRAHFAEHAPAFQIEIAGSGQACMELLRKTDFDLILLDHHLPDMDGLDVLKVILRRGAKMPVVMVTGVGDEELVVKALRMGVANYVPKQGNYLESLPDLLRGVVAEHRRKQRPGLSAVAETVRVLYVEHLPMDVELTQQHFADSAPNFVLEVARTCTEAFDRLVQLPAYDVALIDLRMPDMSGLDFVREAKRRQLTLPPFIMVSGKGDDAAAIATLKLGAADYIVKREGYLNQLAYCIDNAIERNRLDRLNEKLRLELIERERVENALRESEARFRATFEQAAVGMAHVAPDGRWLRVNQKLCDIVGYTREELSQKTFQDITHPDDLDADLAQVRKMLAGEISTYSIEKRYFRKDGSITWVNLTVALLRDATSAPDYFISVIEDIGERKRAEHELEHLAHHDALTSLPNRLLFTELLQQAMADAERHERLVGVALLDLDQFKNINDSLGHATGDTLLQLVGDRLGATLRLGDTVARIGGDEFTLIFADMANIDDANMVLQKIRQSFERPFRIDDRELFATASIGVTVYPFDDRNAQALLRNADVAMYRAKESGSNTWQFYAAEMTEKANENLMIETELRGAIERGELELHYQPQVNLVTGLITGVEALLRWHSARLGDIPPDRFIPLAEKSGQIVPIGEWVLLTACEQAQRWRAEGHTSLRLAVNLSSRQLSEHGLLDRIERILAETGYPADMLELELTESMLLRNVNDTIAVLDRLSALGVRLAIDDFGTGYSNLAYLRRFPVDVLKIDQSFTRHVTSSKDSAAIVRAIITMARALDLDIVAEGVETADQQAFLADSGCHAIQGFYVSKPQAGEVISRMLMTDKYLNSAPQDAT